MLALGHSSEQGAQDNATGVAAILEAMTALNRAIAAGKLPRPRRSIRMLANGQGYHHALPQQQSPARAAHGGGALP